MLPLFSILAIWMTWKFFTSWVWWILGLLILINIINFFSAIFTSTPFLVLALIVAIASLINLVPETYGSKMSLYNRIKSHNGKG